MVQARGRLAWGRKTLGPAHWVKLGSPSHGQSEAVLPWWRGLTCARLALPLAQAPGQLPHPWENEWGSV